MDRLQYQGEEYRRLRGHQLRQTIKGTTMGYRDIIISGNPVHHFDADGRSYRFHGHRGIRIDGIYAVRNDEVCYPAGPSQYTTETSQNCFALYRGAQLGYFITDFSDQSMPTRVNLFRAD